MFVNLVRRVKQALTTCVQALRNHIAARRKSTNSSLVRGSLRAKPQLVAENALLRQQLIVLNRSVKRPHVTTTDRSLLVLLASRVRAWTNALLIAQPDTLLRWHRQGFRLFWRRKTWAGSRAPRIPATTIALIHEMARNNHLWGVKRIQGELLKLDITLSKRTIGRYIRQVRPLPRMVSTGLRSFRTTPARSGRAISCKSTIPCSARCSRSSSPSLARGALCRLASRGRQRMTGSRSNCVRQRRLGQHRGY